MLKLERRKLKLDVYGESYEMDYPTIGQVERLQGQVTKDQDKPEKALAQTKGFLVELGLPKDVVDDLQMDHVVMISEHLQGAKKK